jgi:hypothetical protein
MLDSIVVRIACLAMVDGHMVRVNHGLSVLLLALDVMYLWLIIILAILKSHWPDDSRVTVAMKVWGISFFVINLVVGAISIWL